LEPPAKRSFRHVGGEPPSLCMHRKSWDLTDQMAVRILIVDDHEIFRRGLRSLLESRADWEVCGEATDGQDAVEKAKQIQPEVIVLDITMPRLNGLDAAQLLRKEVPAAKIVILSQHQPALMKQVA